MPTLQQPIRQLALNQTQAAKTLGVSVDHFERHIRDDLPVVPSGKRRLYRTADLEQWLEQHMLRGGRKAA